MAGGWWLVDGWNTVRMDAKRFAHSNSVATSPLVGFPVFDVVVVAVARGFCFHCYLTLEECGSISLIALMELILASMWHISSGCNWDCQLLKHLRASLVENSHAG